MENKKIAICLIIILIVLMALDIITTQIAIGKNHIELNPIMNLIVFSPINHIIAKSAGLILIVIVAFVFNDITEEEKPNSEKNYHCIGLTACCIIYIFIVSNNIIQLIRSF